MKRKQLVIVCAFLIVIPQMIRTQEQRILRDKFAFETAIDMYSVADTAAFNEEAASLIKMIDIEVNKGTLVEDDKIWLNLLQLEPYRTTKQVQTSLLWWLAVRPKLPNERKMNVDFSLLSKAYLEQHFDGVIKMSRFLLADSPENDVLTYAIRNNMALALMHQNKDLCALYELETVKQTSEKSGKIYFPALINLTVLYERLGKRNEAIELSKQLLEHAEKNDIKDPLITFNAAWYMDLNNQNNEMTDKLLELCKSLNQWPVYKYKNFTDKIRSDHKSSPLSENGSEENSKSLPFSEIGLAGKLGLLDSGGKIFGAVLIFLIINIILLRIYWKILDDNYYYTVFWRIVLMYGSIGVAACLFWGLSGAALAFILINLIPMTIYYNQFK